ncbi:uncharacterized protein AMSG_07640 [Thecamonas trahens ATCC 50062]|uniref:Uncharacterized protein n=1 Tax=Thecamonas trahens ATCC 50062 TaxID=461836 RepID=A0A0L0DGV7_THETB|nr:hypothetical protein AMSG_07640 [Thecamonas trahens ATCC 50062]KNC51445.1 hypothetical protein AMSG_07640 [Thecamonas trahens ATCC 50062]|eukprot:XP_013756107.1 hypothetical protein AMSG_07640 [Thecamonas trahens ATCC 50062]
MRKLAWGRAAGGVSASSRSVGLLLLAVTAVVLAMASGGEAVRSDASTVLEQPDSPWALPEWNPTRMFGKGLALAADVNVLAVGEAATLAMPGRTWVYELDAATGGWEMIGNLTTSAVEKDGFGFSLAMTATASRLVVGAHRDGEGTSVFATSEGCVYVFSRHDADASGSKYGPAPDQVLRLPHPAPRDHLGFQVAVTPDGSRIFAMSMYLFCEPTHNSCKDAYTANATNRGIHVWDYDSGVGEYVYSAKIQTFEPELSLTNETLLHSHAGQPFGVSPDGNTVVIKSYDEAYVQANGDSVGNLYAPLLPTLVRRYTYAAGSGWTEAAPLRAPTAKLASQNYGSAIMMDAALGEWYVSAPRNDSTVFRYDAAGGVVQTFAEGNAALYDVSGLGDCNEYVQPWKTDGSYFGQDMALSPNGQMMAIGAPFGVEAETGKGQTYLYTRNVGVSDNIWIKREVFKSSFAFSYHRSGFLDVTFNASGDGYDPAIQQSVMDEFGLDVELNNEVLAIGAKGLNKVYVWSQLSGYLALPPPPPPPPPAAAPIPPPPPPPSGGSIALALILGLVGIAIFLIIMFFALRFGIRAYFRRKYGAGKDLDDGGTLDDASPDDASPDNGLAN